VPLTAFPGWRTPGLIIHYRRKVSVKIRLKRLGKTRTPHYRIVIADSRTHRDGRVIEEIGRYVPTADPSVIEVNSERARYWLGVGAQPTEQVTAILKLTGDFQAARGEKATNKVQPQQPKPEFVAGSRKPVSLQPKESKAKAAAESAAAAPVEVEPAAAVEAPAEAVAEAVTESAAEAPAEAAPAEAPAAETPAEEAAEATPEAEAEAEAESTQAE